MTIPPQIDFRRNALLTIIAVLILVSGIAIGFGLSSKSKPQIPQSSKQEVRGEQVEQTQESSPQMLAANRQSVKVTRVIDGDTIEIEGSQKIRYIGIDTPETVHPDKTVQCFGREATDKNKELTEGKTVELEKDISETDKYERLLRYVYINDLFVNDYLVRQGFAHASSYPPDVKYQDQLRAAEKEARSNNRGLWSQCDLSSQSSQPSSSSQPADCLIKGNISSSGEKIYHMPGQRYYDKMVIDENKGERWFCSEDEAVSAGWRKSKI